MLPLIVLTNCDEVELRYGSLVKRVGPDRETFPHLPHAPVVIDHRHFSKDELGVWGMKWEDVTFTGYVDGEAVAKLEMAADPVPTTLQVVADTEAVDAKTREKIGITISHRSASWSYRITASPLLRASQSPPKPRKTLFVGTDP